MNLMQRLFNILRILFWWPIRRIQFARFGWRSEVRSPLQLDNPGNIRIGRGVRINRLCWLAAMPLCDDPHPVLEFGDGCIIGHFCHIYATSKIIFGKKVLLADHVYISDNQHTYEDPDQPVLLQKIRQCGTVEIGDGSWLGENVCVIGAKIGKHCVIGANSVVTHDIPDFCVAAGTPAKIIKRYDFNEKKWIRAE